MSLRTQTLLFTHIQMFLDENLTMTKIEKIFETRKKM
jgi:hypothetical protein